MVKSNILVTGADQHQGLAVIRGLGLKGIPVVAGSSDKRNMGFYSVYANQNALYTSPHIDLNRFIEDIKNIIHRYQISMIIPAIESTMVALDTHRDEIEALCTLAAPESDKLELTIDKLRTVELSGKIGVPVPKTIWMDDLESVVEATRLFRFPVALKPRGNPLHPGTHNRLGFKVKYACTHSELTDLLKGLRSTGALPMIQEYVNGVAVCVSAFFNRGKPVVLFPYGRLREVPLTGGVSVVRQGFILDDRLKSHVTRLLEEIQWHGIAMVEFKFDEYKHHYVLMEINGRFCASTALAIDSGINFPYMVYRLYSGRPVLPPAELYRPGEIEIWLRGDLQALIKHLKGETLEGAVPEARRGLPSRWRAACNFLNNFRPGVHFDEFKIYDPIPGVFEAITCLRILFTVFLTGLRKLMRKAFLIRPKKCAEETTIGRVVKGGEPKLTIRIIGRCSFRCPFCSTFSDPERKGIMKFSDFKKIMDILAREGFRGVVNISGGEPTLHESLPDMLACASRKLPDCSIVVFTNGHWVGQPDWVGRLRRLLAGDNVLVRFSHDRQHVEGAALATNAPLTEALVREIETLRFKKARDFVEACLAEGAVPGKNFDFAYKGTEEEARDYLAELGIVPIYAIRFRRDYLERPKEMGFFAVEINEMDEAVVFTTLGHIVSGESIGGIERLAEALRLNRLALQTRL